MNEIHTDIIRPDGLAIPDETTQEQWEALHRHILLAKRAAGKWLSQSRSWASDRWGIDYVAETEAQMELALGIETTAPKPSLWVPRFRCSAAPEHRSGQARTPARARGRWPGGWPQQRVRRHHARAAVPPPGRPHPAAHPSR